MGVIRRSPGNPAGKDPFLEDFFRDMSPSMISSFSGEQLRVIKMMFGARERGLYSIDIRFTVPIWGRYIVFLIGREGRTRRRLRPGGRFDPFSAIGDIFVLMVLACLFAAPLALGVYGLNFFFGTEGTGGAIVDGLRQDFVLGIKGM